MIAQSADKEKLEKIHCNDALDLALFVPIRYEDNFLSKRLDEDGVVNILFKPSSPPQTIKNKILKVRGLLVDFDIPCEAVFFNFQKYHRALFITGNEIYLKGQYKYNPFLPQIVQPKVITQINTIEVKYPKSAIQNKTIVQLMRKYLTLDSLLQAGIPQHIAQEVFDVHHAPKGDIKQALEDEKKLNALKYIEIFAHLKRLKNKRLDLPSRNKLTGAVESFLSSLPFALTDAQMKAVQDIQKDFISEKAAKRIVVGDVGCGKTMVILASVAMCYPKRAVLMAPTTILAAQLYEEAKKHLPSHITVSLLVSETKKQNKEESDFLIGTHALLYKDIGDFDLIMVDEQHRFGTNQRNALFQNLRQGELRPHFLQFSATPIPRTMAMIDSAMVDFSFIKELPFHRDVETKVISKTGFNELLRHIKKVVDSGFQAIIVYPLVQESEAHEYLSIAEGERFWKERFENVYVTHGKDKEKQSVLDSFRKEGSILLSTTVIEVGISLPRLSTIVIVGAERLGLATLHQLRGRVGRYGEKGHCFLYTNHPENERLKEFCALESGFDVAELDLRYRNSGDLVSGRNQSGKSFRFFDMVSDGKILEEVRRNLFGELEFRD